MLLRGAGEGRFGVCDGKGGRLEQMSKAALTSSGGATPSRRLPIGGLRHSDDRQPGITRRRAGRGFTYADPDGSTIRAADVRTRIKSLAIPPAWTDVWICPDDRGHLQATGRDARGRKQHRYHPRWTSRRGEMKFDRMLAFAAALPTIRARCDADLGRRGSPREKVLAAVVRLLELTLIRVGNDEYARLNRSFGLTTLRNRHASVRGSGIRFRFRGKSGKHHEVGLRDRRLATIVRRCQDLPGQELFQYLDEDGDVRDVGSADVNGYLREISGADYTAKDFRTWAGTVLAFRALQALEPATGSMASRRNLGAAMRETADRLGNTAAVARNSYVHPAVIEAYLDGRIGGALVQAAEDVSEPPGASTEHEEAAVIRLLGERRGRRAAARRMSGGRRDP